MSFIVVIPARIGSTRLPGKPLADIAGMPLIGHVVERANQSEASRIIVATDDQQIVEALSAYDCEVCLTSPDHLSGSDRLAEVVKTLAILDEEIIVNVQGDEPLIPPRLINEVADTLRIDEGAVMATAAQKISNLDDFTNPNMVKVIMDQQGRAMYFSRAAIPYPRNTDMAEVDAWHHIGIYAYTAKFLKRYAELVPSKLEVTESLEQLRVMDNGEIIMVRTIDYEAGIGVDTQEDLERVRLLIQNDGAK
jgi:3-deoxy-manno-octulosonate cytidylyltransferase (CMP-KDO synthetase)